MNPAARICLTLLALVVTLALASGVVDDRGQAYADAALSRSLVTFGVARALNGVISVAQGTEVALQPAGVGITFTPGQILDPVNDLVERFSWVMLLSSGAIGVLKVLLVISEWVWFSVLTCVALLAAAAFAWYPATRDAPMTGVLARLALLLVVLRLAAPAISILSEGIYAGFLAPQYDHATEQLERTTASIHSITEETASVSDEDDDSLLAAARQLYRSATSQVQVEARLDRYQAAAAEVSRHLVDLIAIFIFQTVLLPLGFLAALYGLVKRLLRG